MPRPASAVADPDTVLAPTYPDHDQATDAPTHAEHEGMDAAVADDDEQLEEDEHDAEQELYGESEAPLIARPLRKSDTLCSHAESSSSPSTETDTLTWINWSVRATPGDTLSGTRADPPITASPNRFCSLPGHEYFCEVAEVRAICVDLLGPPPCTNASPTSTTRTFRTLSRMTST